MVRPIARSNDARTEEGRGFVPPRLRTTAAATTTTAAAATATTTIHTPPTIRSRHYRWRSQRRHRRGRRLARVRRRRIGAPASESAETFLPTGALFGRGRIFATSRLDLAHGRRQVRAGRPAGGAVPSVAHLLLAQSGGGERRLPHRWRPR